MPTKAPEQGRVFGRPGKKIGVYWTIAHVVYVSSLRSLVDGAIDRVEDRFVNRLGYRGMRENRLRQLPVVELCAHGDNQALNLFGDFGADHMSTDQFSAIGVEHGFY